MTASKTIPSFDDLPLNKNDPFLSAWGLYGKDDKLGFLNRLTPDVVLAAAKEIKTGKRISLDWALDAPQVPLFGRPAFQHKIVPEGPKCVNDDFWSLNTQSSSQWDGFRHYGYQKERRFYNGVTMEEIHSGTSTANGIGAWAKEGIVGRGVLLDYFSWATAQGRPPTTLGSHAITLQDLHDVAASQGTELQFGDVLLIRTGYMHALNSMSSEELSQWGDYGAAEKGWIGIKQGKDMLRYIWENFSAVACDAPSLEVWPPQTEIAMHEVLLAGWGCPIGELFDLEALATYCKEIGRWTFFTTSEVCNVPGGVASPPNMLAIF